MAAELLFPVLQQVFQQFVEDINERTLGKLQVLSRQATVDCTIERQMHP